MAGCSSCGQQKCCCQQYRGERGKQGLPGRQGNPGARTPGVQSFSFSNGSGDPFIVGGTAAGQIEAVIPWEGLTNYPLNTPVRMWAIVYGTGSPPDFDIEIIDLTNGSAVIARALNQAGNTSGNIVALTLVNPVSNGRAAWGIKLTDHNLSVDKVNLQSVTIEFN